MGHAPQRRRTGRANAEKRRKQGHGKPARTANADDIILQDVRSVRQTSHGQALRQVLHVRHAVGTNRDELKS